MSQSRVDFAKGAAVVKYSRAGRPTQRILKLKDDVLQWHKPRRSQRPRCLQLFNIANISLSCSDSHDEGNCLFVVETAFRAYWFKVESETEAKQWVNELKRKAKHADIGENTQTTDDNEGGSTMQDTRDDGYDKYTDVLKQVQGTLEKYFGMPVPADRLVECLAKAAVSSQHSTNTLARGSLRRHRQSMSEGGMSKLRMGSKSQFRGETGKERDEVAEVNKLINSEHAAGKQLAKEFEQTIRANAELIDQEHALKAELTSATALSHNVARLLAKQPKATSDAKLDALQRGFQGYLCSFSPEAIKGKISSIPRYLADEEAYKKQHIATSQGNSVLVWKAIGLFGCKKALLKFKDVEQCKEGFPGAARLQPFDGYAYLTLYSRNLTVVLAVNPQLSIYLEAIMQLHSETHNKGIRRQTGSASTFLKQCSSHLSNQLQLHKRLMSSYISSVEVKFNQDSLCELSRPNTALEQLTAEIRYLREVCAAGVDGFLSGGVEDYLRKERTQLQQSLLNVSEIVVKSADCFN